MLRATRERRPAAVREAMLAVDAELWEAREAVTPHQGIVTAAREVAATYIVRI